MEENHQMYVKRNNGCLVILSTYVDDILLEENNLEMLSE